FLRAVIKRLDQRGVSLGDESATYLLGTRKFTVVGIELLVQNQEPLDLRACHHLVLGERAVHLRYMFFKHVVDKRVAGELLIGGVDYVVTFCPASNRSEIDIEHDA